MPLSRLWRRVLGGRPMTLEGYAFFDVVVRREVYYWRDRYGRRWLAHGRWGWFRVPPRSETD